MRPAVQCVFLLAALLWPLSSVEGARLTTYLGGSGDEIIHDVAVDDAGDLWVVGETNSADFPGSPAPGSSAPNGSRQAFVLRLTYADPGGGPRWTPAERFLLGGSRDDRARRVVAAGQWIIIAGETTSSDFPGSFAPGAQPGGESLFLTVIDRANGPAIKGSVLVGGSGGETLADLVALPDPGCVALAATTDSTGLAALNSSSAALPQQATLAGGADAFLLAACVDPGGGPRVTHVTYFGGSADDSARSLNLRGDAICLGGGAASPDLAVTPDAAETVLKVGSDGYVACYRSTVNAAGGGGFLLSSATYAGASGARVETLLAAYPDDAGELLVGVVSDSPVGLFAAADPVPMAGGFDDNPGAGSLAFGGVGRSLDVATRRFWIGGTDADRLIALDADGSCALALAEVGGVASLVRFCTTDGAGGPRVRHAQTLRYDLAAVGSFLPVGLTVEPVLAAEGVTVGGAAVWGAVAAPQPGDIPIADADAPQPVFGGGNTDGLLRLELLPFLIPGAVAGAADFQARPIAPGQLLAIFGSAFGPPSTQSGTVDSTTGLLPTRLGPTRVLFDEFEAPLNFTAANQLGVIAPFGIEGRSAVTAIVEVDGTPSNPATLGVAVAAPGLFTVDQSGSGPAAAVNQDFSANTPAAPVGYGTSISLFLSGCGATTPAGRDGALVPNAPPFPQLLRPVEVAIGGLPAKITYAGAAPGAIEGVCQINAETPAGAQLGDSPVIVTVGGIASRPDVTVSVAQSGGGTPGRFSDDPGEIRSCSQLCGGLRALAGLLDNLLGVPLALTEKGDACECFALLFPIRDY